MLIFFPLPFSLIPKHSIHLFLLHKTYKATTSSSFLPPSMADSNYSTKLQHQSNPTKFYSHFLYKALIVAIFCVLLPIFPSEPPEFINQTLNTRGWEFLHLIFVGIAVSYGLFSRRNDEPEKENINNSHQSSKFDNAQSYVSKFLQVSSVFDDEGDAPSKSDEISTVHSWNNQYRRNEPVVVVADHERGSGVIEKPLLLPIRSLKSRVVDADSDEIRRESFDVSANSKPQSIDLEENNAVLPSPIPWRSRSGRMELKQEPNSPLYSQSSSSVDKSEFNRSSKAQPSRLSRSDSTISSPRKLPTEAQGKSEEDFVRKKHIFRSPPPPPPPPPPPHLLPKSKTMKPIRNEDFTPQRSFTMPKSVRTISGGNEFDESSFRIDQKVNRERVSFMPQPTFMEYPKEEKEETVEKLVLESETEDEEEDDEIEMKSFNSVPSGGSSKEQSGCTVAGSDAEGPDVDKKADEFIAKFREQIRLQRIESIKRSSGQINRKITR